MFTVVMKIEGEKVAKYQSGFASQEDAQTHVATHLETHPAAFVVATPDAPVIWWRFDANRMIITAPPAALMEELRGGAITQVQSRHAEMLVKHMGDYTPAMRETFSKQLEWARGYQADQNAAHAANLEGMLSDQTKAALVATSQVPAQVVADKIIAKDAFATQLVIIANRTLAEAEEAIEATTTPVELEAALAGLADVEAAAIAELAALA